MPRKSSTPLRLAEFSCGGECGGRGVARMSTGCNVRRDMKRRKQLIVRQSLAYRSGQSTDARWHVGYWDDPAATPPDEAFRSFGGRPTREEAVALARRIAADNAEYA